MGRYHANVLAAPPGVRFSGVHDTDPRSAGAVAGPAGVPVFTSLEGLFRVSDAVCIAVPTAAHESVACAALEAGMHVLLEKPVAPTPAAATRIMETAARCGRIPHVGHVERFNGAIRQMRAIVNRPSLIEARRLAPYSPRSGDVGVVLDLMIHDLDIVLHLVDSPLVSLQAAGSRVRSGHEDVATTVLTFENGCLAVLTASRITQDKIRALAVTQPDGYISLDYTTQEINIHRQTGQEYQVAGREIRYSIASTIERVFVHTVNPLQQELAHFVACINGDETSLISNEHDLKALETALAVLDRIGSAG